MTLTDKNGHKTCGHCGGSYPIELFTNIKSGKIFVYCQHCREAFAHYTARHRSKANLCIKAKCKYLGRDTATKGNYWCSKNNCYAKDVYTCLLRVPTPPENLEPVNK